MILVLHLPARKESNPFGGIELRKAILAGVALGLLFLTACSAEQELAMVGVEIVFPDSVSAGEETVLEAHVSFGKEKVLDADEVQFEIRLEGLEAQSQLVDAVHDRDGIYVIRKVFDQEGIYVIQAHVTARDMHVMPKKKLAVGDGYKLEEDGHAEQDGSEEHDHNH